MKVAKTKGRYLLLVTLMLVVSAVLLGPPVAAAKVPPRPTALSPAGSLTTDAPTFKWGKVQGAKQYELRVFEGSTWLLKVTGIARTSWKCSEDLPFGVRLTWRVRARNASGAGPWSRTLSFTLSSPLPPPQVMPDLLGNWSHLDYFWFEIVAAHSLALHADGTYRKQVLTDGMYVHGLLTEVGIHADTETSILFSDVRQTWEPAADDPSGIAAYENVQRPDYEWSYALADDESVLDVVDQEGKSMTWERVSP